MSEDPTDNIHLQQLFKDAHAEHQAGRLDAATSGYRKVLELSPKHFDALQMLGLVAFQQGQINQGIGLVLQAIAVRPDQFGPYANLSKAYQMQGKLVDALGAIDRAISLKPDHALNYSNRAVLLRDMQRHEESLASSEQAIELDERMLEANFSRILALQELGRHSDALEDCDRLLTRYPDHARAHGLRGLILMSNMTDLDSAMGEKRMIVESIDSYRFSLQLDPDNPETHRNLGIALLLKGDYEEGWGHYEWRLKLPAYKAKESAFHQPLWAGDTDLKGKTILLYAEQGYGDTIQFCRYAPLVAALGARVVLQAPPALLPLLGELPNVLTIGEGLPVPECDCRCPLMSLPHRFSARLENLSSQTSYLAANTAKRDYWQRKLGTKTLPRIGLVWSGNPNHRNDHNRSMPLQGLLDAIPDGFDLFSLQKQAREEDVVNIGQNAPFRHFGDDLQDFADTAALVSLMDLVITVDTSVAHLSGALGIPTWIMLPYVPDWRWMLNRDDSPWYPSVRLFRQAATGQWPTVLTSIALELGKHPFKSSPQ